MTRRVLVVAAHSDDEALGCGGTIARNAAEGDIVHVIFLTNGVGARGVDTVDTRAADRRHAAERALAVLGVTSSSHFDFPDNGLDNVSLLDIVQAIEPVIADFKPDTIYTHFAHDLNVDHRICHQAVLTACRPQPSHPVRAIYEFEVASSTEWSFSETTFHPQHFVDISQHFDTKLRALSEYAEELRPPPHPRSDVSIEALARWRGANVGCAMAEAFRVVRQII